ncbi:unnamed protein product [Agarophyton chilense]
MLSALCREESSLNQLIQGCRRAQTANRECYPEILFDFYDGTSFRCKHGQEIRFWNEEPALIVFLTMSTDWFEIIREKRKTRTIWPLVFTILNLGHTYRSRASNALATSFIPGSHDGKHFDNFLVEIIKDLSILEKTGVQLQCADGKQRNLKAYVLFGTTDWPAASKIDGFTSHNAKRSCRYCHKQARKVAEAPKLSLLPEQSTFNCKLATINVGKALEWLTNECPEPRTNNQTRAIWKKYDVLRRTSHRGSALNQKHIMKTTGIKRRPFAGTLPLDFVQSLPYDPMHTLLLGWVKLVANLILGLHPKDSKLPRPFILLNETKEQLRY